MQHLPAPVVQEINGILVVRDDLIQGGTKARIAPLLFGASAEYVYASPVYGYAQIALAHAAKAAGKQAVIFCAKRNQLHPRTLEAQSAGAIIHEVPCGYMSVVRCRASEYCHQNGSMLLPFGLDSPEIVTNIATIAKALPIKPTEVWTVAGSGVLTRALQIAWPCAEFHAVQVGAVPNAGRAQIYVAPEKFPNDAKIKPPFPSCSNYDAKAWRFIQSLAKPGSLFWNVAA